jgi:hypothetical protein
LQTPALPDGVHRFAVRAIDAGGEADQTPALSTFTVAVAPVLSRVSVTHAKFRVGKARTAVIATATRSGYLLGYAPTNTTFDGTFRRIAIKVNRPNATVLYRHGYFGRDQLTAFDGRQAMTYHRIAAATNVNGGVRDIKVSFNATEVRDRGGQALTVDIKIDPLA